MKYILLSFIVIALTISVSCKTSKPAADAHTQKTPAPVANEVNTAPTATAVADAAAIHEDAAEEIFDLVISFISIGEGIDYIADKAILEAISKKEKEYKKETVRTESRWGREGEKDYCIQLTGYSDDEKKEFIKAIKNSISNEKNLVRFTENTACKAKRF